MVMSATQKALLYANIPTSLYEYTVEKRLRDRFLLSPVTYPAMTVSFLSEGIQKSRWNTWAPTQTTWNEDTQRYDNYYGGQEAATISITLWSETEDELRALADSLMRQIKLRRLDLDWAMHHLKVTTVKGVQWLEPFADEFIQEHTWRAVIDFEIEYLWEELEIAPAIRSYQYLFESGVSEYDNTAELDTMYSADMGSYLMGISISGWHSTYTIDWLALKDISSTASMSMKVV